MLTKYLFYKHCLAPHPTGKWLKLSEIPPVIVAALESDDPNPIIVEAAGDAERSCEICVATVDAFASILGAEAGNMALKVLATGGVYLAGGIPRRALPALQERFVTAFRRKGRMSSLLGAIPVHVIINPRVALLGAACCGLGL